MSIFRGFLQRTEWQTATCGLLCFAALVFPFSVAATNVALGVALGLGIISGQAWAGARLLWDRFRWLVVSLLVYFSLLVLGLAWSNDIRWGLHILGRQWFWLIVPLLVTALASEVWRNRFLAALSLGLALHLGFCLLQMYGHAPVTVRGSGILDATGHIGHIGFGFVYSIWAGWLLHWGWERSGLIRWLAWALSLWAWVMIFAAQGRSGYLVALAVMAVILWKHLLGGHGWQSASLALVLFLAVIASMIVGPGKERVQSTLHSLQAFHQGHIGDAEARWSLWIGAVEAWKSRPALGVGTGGFPKAAATARQQRPELHYASNPGEVVAHPHNMYLLALARWSVWGVAALCMLLFIWIRIGWRLDWNRLQAGPLITLSGISLVVHGLSAPSLEEHFSGVLAALLLGLGLAELSAGGSNQHFRIKHNPAGSMHSRIESEHCGVEAPEL